MALLFWLSLTEKSAALDQIDVAFEAAIGMAEMALFTTFRLDEASSSIEFSNIDKDKIRDQLELFDRAAFRGLPSMVMAMVEKMIKNNDLKAYLDAKTTAKALREWIN